MPVSSFAPEFLEIFKSAAQEEILIPVGDEKRAIRLRFRLNMLRRDMRKEGHTLTTIANSVQFSITPEGDLMCAPADASFLDAISKAGVTIGTPSTTTPASTNVPLLKPERAAAEETIQKFFAASKKDKELE